MKDGNYQNLQIEGYDNPKAKFVTTSINNHIGSNIEMQIGSFDLEKRLSPTNGKLNLFLE